MTGIRLLAAAVPGLFVALADSQLPGCWGSEAPWCIWFWQPPFLDVLFALFVLAPFIERTAAWPARTLALVIVSVFVHWQAAELVAGLRGTLSLPGVDTIYLNVAPIAVLASLAIAGAVAVVGGLRTRPRYWGLACLAGVAGAAAFLAPDLNDSLQDRLLNVPLALSVWLPWHVGLCAAIHYGRAPKHRAAAP